jgi:hypothetical protein
MLRNSAVVFLLPYFAIAVNGGMKHFGKGVYTRYSHTVKAPGNFVGILIEFAPGMKNRHYYLQGRPFFLFVHVGGYATAVILNRNGIIFIYRNLYRIAIAGQGLVNGVIHYLPNQMMQAFNANIAYVHGRALANGLQTL